MVFVKRHTNDQEGKSGWKRIGWRDDLCLVRQTEGYLHSANLYTHASCLK